MPRTASKESELVKATIAFLKLIGVLAWRQNSGKAFTYVKFCGADGIGDVCGILPGGRFLSIECKKQGGRIRPNQTEFMELVNKQGGLAFVAYDLGDVCREVRAAISGDGIYTSPDAKTLNAKG